MTLSIACITVARRVGLSLVALPLVAACARVLPVPTDVESPGMANPEVALRQSMSKVDAQMAQLGGLSPRATVAAAPLPVVFPEPLQRTISFSWDGPLDEGVARLAASVGYTFFVTAPSGHVPMRVSVAVRDVPAWHAFRALGEAAGTTATVRLLPVHAQVQVIYRG